MVASAQDHLTFLRYIYSNYSPTDSLKKKCGWSYCFVKIKLDVQNKITDVIYLLPTKADSLNTANLNYSLDFLIGYQYPGKVKNAKTLLFYFSLEHSSECDPKRLNNPDPNDVVALVLNTFADEKRKDPNLELMHDPLIILAWEKAKN
jgi:hypothetical protein